VIHSLSLVPPPSSAHRDISKVPRFASVPIAVLLLLVEVSSLALEASGRLDVAAPLRTAFLVLGLTTIVFQNTSADLSATSALTHGLALLFSVLILGPSLMVEVHFWHPLSFELLLTALILLGQAAPLSKASAWRPPLPTALRSLVIRPSLLSVAGMVICLTVSVVASPLTPGPLGFVSSIPWPWFLGAATCVAALLLAFHAERDLAVAAPILATLIAATTALAYSEPRFPWLAKHVGVVEYILLHHAVNPTIDIYQAWPGFFAAIAWLLSATSLHNPWTIARAWPIVIDLSTLLVIKELARRLLSTRTVVPWLVALLLSLSMSFGQDYFSPQSVGLLLAFLIFALAVPVNSDPYPALRLPVLLLASFALALTHQLSPYPVFGALVVLTLFGLVRPWWTPLLPLLPALLWAASNFSAWRSYLSPSAFGDVISNTHLANTGGTLPLAPVVHLTNYTLGAALVAVGLCATIDIATHPDRFNLALLLAALSPLPLILVTNYGGEADNRVVFFAMPWLALVAGPWLYERRHGKLFPSIFVATLSLTSLIAITGLDQAYVPSSNLVRAEEYVESVAPAGSFIVSAGSSDGTPSSLSARYPLFSFGSLTGIDTQIQTLGRVPRDSATILATALRGTFAAPAYYVVASKTTAYYDADKGIESVALFLTFEKDLSHSPDWDVYFRSGDAIVWKLNLPLHG